MSLPLSLVVRSGAQDQIKQFLEGNSYSSSFSLITTLPPSAPPIQNLVSCSAVNSEATTAKPRQRPSSLCIWGCRWNNTLESNRSLTDKAQAKGALLYLFTVKHNLSIFPTKERTLVAAAQRPVLSLWSVVSGARHSKGSCRAGVGQSSDSGSACGT